MNWYSLDAKQVWAPNVSPGLSSTFLPMRVAMMPIQIALRRLVDGDICSLRGRMPRLGTILR